MKNLSNKWTRAAIPALLLHCSIGTVYCWSLFSGPIHTASGLDAAALEWAFSLAIFFLGMSAAFLGNFVEKNIHLAVADDNDEYMGTVSLKHVDKTLGFAEFAITLRAVAMGKGFSKFGMAEILKHGIETLGLKNVYWCVSAVNARAVRFYDKCGYSRTDEVPSQIKDLYSGFEGLIWYVYN